MDRVISEVHIDNLMEATIDIDPETKSQVLAWMKSAAACNNTNKEVE